MTCRPESEPHVTDPSDRWTTDNPPTPAAPGIATSALSKQPCSWTPSPYARRADAVRVLAELEWQFQIAGLMLGRAGSKVLFNASLRDLMTRMGHDSPAAALIYQHEPGGGAGDCLPEIHSDPLGPVGFRVPATAS